MGEALPSLRLYLLRHGAAQSRAADGRDSSRLLTPSGEGQARAIARLFQSRDPLPEHILASPYTRAQQTARLIAEVWNFSDAVIPAPTCTPDHRPEDLWDAVRELDASSVLVVTHEPLVSASLAWFTRALVPPFDTAELARLDFSSRAPRGQLRWRLTPEPRP